MPAIHKFLFILIVTCTTQSAWAQFSVDLEGNYVAGIPYNVVRIPATGGTEVDIANDLEVENTFTYRIRVNYTIGERHVISALAAPLTINSSGRFPEDVVYSGQTFDSNLPVRVRYKFNSYRLTYRYLFINRETLQLGAGLTAKVRDANITFTNESTTADYPDLGVVPLINFYFRYEPVNRLNLLIEGDALVTKQGRAEDIFAGLSYEISDRVQAKAGYRFLEGGADVEKNYNFSWINYAAAGIVINLGGER